MNRLNPNSKLTLGQKIKNFRTRAGLSQMDLETAINAANGSISRIESDQVNPTKETLIQISNALKLPPTERFYLLDEKYEEITPKDIESAIETVSEVLNDPNFLGYLIDDKYNIVAISGSFMQFIANLGVDPAKLVNKNMVEVVFNPELGIRNAIDKDSFEFVAMNLLSFFNQELHYRLQEQWWKDLYAKVEDLPEFKEIWAKTQSQKINGYSPTSRAVPFAFGDTTLDAQYSLITVYTDPRFTLSEYTIQAS